MELNRWLQKLQKSKWVFFATLAIGILLRFWFVFFKDLNLDQATSLGFIQHDGWGSIWWDNSPPLLYIIGKGIKELCGSDMRITFLILKGLIFSLSTASMLLMVHLIRSKLSANWLWIFALCVFPTALVDTTTVRPTFFTEFFAILNFWVFKRSQLNQWSLRRVIIFVISSLGLLASSYLAALYFVGLFFISWSTNQSIIFKQNNLDAKVIGLISLFSLFVGLILISKIRWENLSWIGGDANLHSSFISSVFWIRNLMGYNWIALLLFIFGIAFTRKWKLLLPLLFLLFINSFTGRVAEEPRFVIFYWPLFFYWTIELDQALNRTKWYSFFRYLVVFIWVIQTAWFFKEPRSSLSDAQSFIQEAKIDSMVIEISKSALDFAFPGISQANWEELKTKSCPHITALLSPQHRPQYDRDQHLLRAQKSAFKFDSERIFANKLETVEVLIFKRDCPP